MSDTQTLCGYPSCDCERDPPPDPAYCAKRLPTREEQMRAALRFYASRSHYSLDDAEEFDTVSGEPVNWLFSGRDESTTMIEDGSIARAVLEEIYGPSALVYTAAALASEREAGRREMRHEAAMEAWMLAQKFAADPDDDGVVHWLNEAEAAIRALPVKGTMAQTGDE